MTFQPLPTTAQLLAAAESMPHGWGVREYPSYVDRLAAWHRRTPVERSVALVEAGLRPTPPADWCTRRFPDADERRQRWEKKVRRKIERDRRKLAKARRKADERRHAEEMRRAAQGNLFPEPLGPALPPALAEQRARAIAARTTSQNEEGERMKAELDRRRAEFRSARRAGELVFRREAVALGYSHEVIAAAKTTRPGKVGPWYYCRQDHDAGQRRLEQDARRRAVSISRQELLTVLPRGVVDDLRPDWTEEWTYYGAGSGERYWYLLQNVQPLIDAHGEKRGGTVSREPTGEEL